MASRFFARLLARSIGVLSFAIVGTTADAAEAPPNVWMNHGPEGGSVNAIVPDPTAANIIYLGTDGGVFKSTDAGATWRLSSTGLEAYQVDTLAIVPGSPTTLYAGTTYPLYRSVDGAETWQQLGPGFDTGICALAVDPETPTTIYAGNSLGVFKSTDGGATWNPIRSGLSSGQFCTFAIDPLAPDTLYVGTGSGVFKSNNGGGTWSALSLTDVGVYALLFDPTDARALYAATSSGAFISTDGGESWTNASAGLTDTTVLALTGDPTRPGTFYAGTRYSVFKTLDGGAMWTEANNGRSYGAGSIAVNPQDPDVIYAGASDLAKSTNGADSWKPANSGLIATAVYEVAADPLTEGTLYTSTSNGEIFRSIDAGTTWHERGQLPFTPDALVADPSKRQTVYVGGVGVYKSTDGGAHWENSSTGLYGNVYSVAIDPTDSDILYAATDYGVSRSEDAARLWNSANRGLTTLALDLAIDPIRPSTLYAATLDGVFRSDDGAATWSVLSEGPSRASAIAVDPVTPTTLFTASGTVFKSVDGGATWNELSGLPGSGFSDVAIDPIAHETIYVSSQSYSVFKSTDGGTTWVELQIGLTTPRYNVHALVADPFTPDTVYAATNGGGVFVIRQSDLVRSGGGDDGCALTPTRGNDALPYFLVPMSLLLWRRRCVQAGRLHHNP